MRLTAELSVGQHRAKTQITAEIKETEKQRGMEKKRSRMVLSSSIVSLSGGGSGWEWEEYGKGKYTNNFIYCPGLH